MTAHEDRLQQRPDLAKKLSDVAELIEASSVRGSVAITALQTQNVQFLLFDDNEMDNFARPDTSAFFGRLSGQGYIGLRQSILEDDGQVFRLIKDLAHESIHVSQKDTLPQCEAILSDPLHRDYTSTVLLVEKDAYAGTVEILLRMAHAEATAMAREGGHPVAMKQTSIMKDWMAHYPEEAILCMKAFENKEAHSGNIDEGINAARAVSSLFYDVHFSGQDIAHCEDKIQRTRERVAARSGFSLAPRQR